MNSKVMVEVEVENLDELQQALAAKVDRILIDNFSNEDMTVAVRIAREHQEQRHRAGSVREYVAGDAARRGRDGSGFHLASAG